MSQKQGVVAVTMGLDNVAQINSSVPNLNSGTAARNTLTVAAAQTVTFSTSTSTLILAPSVSPTGPIFIKWGVDGAQTVATATVFDLVLTPTYPSAQIAIISGCNSYSIYSGTSQTVYATEL